jgi:hypothetical protein
MCLYHADYPGGHLWVCRLEVVDDMELVGKSRWLKTDELVKSRKNVTPAKAGVQNLPKILNPRLRGDDAGALAKAF